MTNTASKYASGSKTKLSAREIRELSRQKNGHGKKPDKQKHR